MKVKVIQIGNSRGIRIPKPLLDQFAFADEVELEAENDALVIRASKRPRHGWNAAFQEMAKRGDDQVLGGVKRIKNNWDEEGWEW